MQRKNIYNNNISFVHMYGTHWARMRGAVNLKCTKSRVKTKYVLIEGFRGPSGLGFLFCYGQGEKFWQLIHPVIYIHYLPQSGGIGVANSKGHKCSGKPSPLCPIVLYLDPTGLDLYKKYFLLTKNSNFPEANFSFLSEENIFAICTPSLRSVANTT